MNIIVWKIIVTIALLNYASWQACFCLGGMKKTNRLSGIYFQHILIKYLAIVEILKNLVLLSQTIMISIKKLFFVTMIKKDWWIDKLINWYKNKIIWLKMLIKCCYFSIVKNITNHAVVKLWNNITRNNIELNLYVINDFLCYIL